MNWLARSWTTKTWKARAGNRLPKAMAALPELQNPAITTLRPRDIVACFRANLWETSTQRMVNYGHAAGSSEVTA